MGKMAVEAAIKILKGESLEAFTEVPVILVTNENLEEFRKQKQLCELYILGASIQKPRWIEDIGTQFFLCVLSIKIIYLGKAS